MVLLQNSIQQTLPLVGHKLLRINFIAYQINKFKVKYIDIKTNIKRRLLDRNFISQPHQQPDRLRNYNMLLSQSGSDKYLQPERIIAEITAANNCYLHEYELDINW